MTTYHEYMRFCTERDKPTPIIKRNVYQFLRQRLPRQFKRMCFMSSIASILNPIKTKEEVVDVLFYKMNLGHSPYAVEAPVIAAEWLWKETLPRLVKLLERAVEITHSYYTSVDKETGNISFITDIPNAEEEMENIVDEIIRIAPGWMIYHDTIHVANDLAKVIGNFAARPKNADIA